MNSHEALKEAPFFIMNLLQGLISSSISLNEAL